MKQSRETARGSVRLGDDDAAEWAGRFGQRYVRVPSVPIVPDKDGKPAIPANRRERRRRR